MLTHQSMRDVCAQVAPTDGLDRNYKDADKDGAKELLGRKLSVVRAALTLTATLARESETDRAEVAEYLKSVSDYMKAPSSGAAKKVAASIASSDLVSKVAAKTTHRNLNGEEIRKAIYYTLHAAASEQPSECASYLLQVANATARYLERKNGEHSGVYHQTVAGLISGAVMAAATV